VLPGSDAGATLGGGAQVGAPGGSAAGGTQGAGGVAGAGGAQAGGSAGGGGPDAGSAGGGTMGGAVQVPSGPADPGKRGPFTVSTENNVGPGGAFTLVRPNELGQGGITLHPVITWGNGTGTMPSTYSFLLTHLASHGFVVIASNNTNVGSGQEMLQGVDWVLQQNMDASSKLYQKIDPAQIGATGHSQGGLGTLAAGADPRIKATAPIEGAIGFGGFGGSGLHGPILLLAGGMDTTIQPDGVRSYYNGVSDVPAALGILLNASHESWIMDGIVSGISGLGGLGGFTAGGGATGGGFIGGLTGGATGGGFIGGGFIGGGGAGGGGMQGGFVRAVTAWMRLFLMNDQTLKPLFAGSGCGYCTDSEWTYESKKL
jgi:hypothetical protein